jgi:hypothetical protein
LPLAEAAALNVAAENSVQGTVADWSQQPDDRLQSKELRRHIQKVVSVQGNYQPSASQVASRLLDAAEIDEHLPVLLAVW